jgi:HTH-type transcriptional regulator, transcriptional repressor of NAD biosynthesis genes
MCSEKPFYHSVVCGKFYPPHKGHHYLIDTAIEHSDNVTVIVCWRSDETVPVEKRIECLKEEHPTIKIISVPCIPDDDDSPGWGKYTLNVLGFTPNAVFSSEKYGIPYAEAMGCEHVEVDIKRKNFPISGTQVRCNPYKYFDFLSPAMRAYYALRIVVVGAESTGTTTLAEALAKKYKTVCVPEYGRTYTKWKYEKGNVGWYWGEFTHIAEEQNKLEDLYARNANKVLICDTDSLATMLWQKRYCGSTSEMLRVLGKYRNTFYILTGDEIPFAQDEDNLRDGEHIRHEMHEGFISLLNDARKKYIIVTGSHDQRMNDAIIFIDGIMRDAIKKPPVYCKHVRFITTVVDDTHVSYNNYGCKLGNDADPKWCECKTATGPCSYREEK